MRRCEVFCLVLAALVCRAAAFVAPGVPLGRAAPKVVSARASARASPVSMGLFDGFKDMMEKAGDKRYVRSRHILIKDKGPEVMAKLEGIKEETDNNPDTFSQFAKEISECSSARNGGMLRMAARGEFTPEFDMVVFSEEVGKVHGPFETTYGTHLVYIDSRKEPQNTWKMLFDGELELFPEKKEEGKK